MFKKVNLLLALGLLSLTLVACAIPGSQIVESSTTVDVSVEIPTASMPSAVSFTNAPAAEISTVADTGVTIDQGIAAGTYPIVDTGQGTCYDARDVITCPAEGEAFYGQDAQFTGNTPSYTDNGNGTVTDNITGLIWQQSADTDGNGNIDAADKLSYTNAGTYCENLSYAGQTDWELPTIKQLYSLIDFSGLDPSGYGSTNTSGLLPFIDTDYFDFAYGDTNANERIIDAQYASSSLYVGDGGRTMFGINFADGRIKGYPTGPMPGQSKDKGFFVICARNTGTYGQNSFIDNGDSTITDSATGLMWAQNDSGSDAPNGLNWEETLSYVETQNAANYLGYSDWRLPNVKKLQSILDYGRSPDTTNSAAIDPLFNATAITNEAGQTDYAFYWSSTTHANWTNNPGAAGAYVSFGRALGYMNDSWQDVHGAGAQRSDPKSGNPADWPTGRGPQGDALRIYNYVRLVRSGNVTETLTGDPAVNNTAAIVAPADSSLPAQPVNQANAGPDGQPMPNVAAAAATLGISEQALMDALGPPPPDLAATAQTLGITEADLVAALGVPADGQPPADNPPSAPAEQLPAVQSADSGNQPPGSGGQMPDLASAAAQLGVTEEALQAALGEPGQGPPDFAAVAATLGVTEEALIEALGVPEGGPPQGGGQLPAGGPPPGGGQPPTNAP